MLFPCALLALFLAAVGTDSQGKKASGLVALAGFVPPLFFVFTWPFGLLARVELLTRILGLHTQSGWDKGHAQADGVPGGGAAAVPHHL